MKMRIILLAQEEPVYFGPFFRKIIEALHQEIVLIVIAGQRGAGSHPKNFKEKLVDIYSQWLMFEPAGFLRNLSIGLWQRMMLGLGIRGYSIDQRTVQGAAQHYHIPVIMIEDPNSQASIQAIKKYSPDVIINQSELLLKEEFLKIPQMGVINRHASLLPHFRGRVGSFWAHASEPPEYGVTIHFVDSNIDAGPIILQRSLLIDPRSSYTKVLDTLFQNSADLMLAALGKIREPDFEPKKNQWEGTRTYLFPTLRDVKTYRAMLKKRRTKNS